MLEQCMCQFFGMKKLSFFVFLCHFPDTFMVPSVYFNLKRVRWPNKFRKFWFIIFYVATSNKDIQKCLTLPVMKLSYPCSKYENSHFLGCDTVQPGGQVPVHKTTWRHIPENSNLHTLSCLFHFRTVQRMQCKWCEHVLLFNFSNLRYVILFICPIQSDKYGMQCACVCMYILTYAVMYLCMHV